MRTKSGGDYLVTLLAYVTGELGAKLSDRRYALKCLKLVLERDFTATNKVSSDGGAALHCVLAASSCGDTYNYSSDGLEDDSDSDDGDDDDDDSDYYDSDDDDSNIDPKYLSEITEGANADLNVESYCQEYDCLSSEEIALAAILLLLNNGADPNKPLGNVHGLKANDNNGDDGDQDDDEELELTFSRESIVQQWTPLMFVVQWVTMACISSLNDDEDRSNDNTKVPLPIAVLRVLLDYNADMSYMMAGEKYFNTKYDWNVLQVLASVSHILEKLLIHGKTLSTTMVAMEETCISVLSISIEDRTFKSEHNHTNEERESLYNFIAKLIDAKQRDLTLTPNELFATAILTNNAPKAQLIIDGQCRSTGLDSSAIKQKFSQTYLLDILPVIRASWGNASMERKTLFDIACSCFATDVLKIMIGDGKRGHKILSDQDIANGIVSAFEDLGQRSISENLEQNNARINVNTRRVIDQQISLINLVLGECLDIASCLERVSRRQRILDKLLTESCSGRAWTLYSPHATLALLQLGADPNIESIVNLVNDSLRPLHFVAGNCRGSAGVEKVQWLLGHYQDTYENETKKQENIESCDAKILERKANLRATSISLNEMPIHIALRLRNYDVASKILDEMGDTWLDLKWSFDNAVLIGQVSIETSNVKLFKQALTIITNSALRSITSSTTVLEDSEAVDSTTCKRKVEKAIGGLLLKIMDERSGFGKIRPLSTAVANINDAIKAVVLVQDQQKLTNLASWARDEISGHNIIHLILRGDRGELFRNTLLAPICELVANSEGGDKLISQACAKKFGGYSPLHLAVALGDDSSINTLLHFNADVNALDAQGNKAKIESFREF